MIGAMSPVATAAEGQGYALSFCRLDDDRDMALAEAAHWLSAPETARAARFRFDLHRNRFIRGRGFLRRALAAELGGSPSDVALTVEARDKPCLAGSDRPGFNLSHSGDLAVLALRPDGPVGVDLEWARSGIDAAALSRTCYQPHEISALMRLDGAARLARFFTFWTAKEALMKLTGQGMFLDPKEIALTLRDGWPVGISAPRGLADTRLEFPDTGRRGLHLAVAWHDRDPAYEVGGDVGP